MADVGTAYLRIAGDFSQVNAQAVGLFKSSKWSGLGKAAGVGIAGGLAAAGIGKVLFDIGKQFDSAFDKITTQTGATGKQLGKLEESFRHVIRDVPADFDTASTAIAGLNQRLGLTGKPLERVAKQLSELSRLTGTDIQENVESTTRLFGDWSIKTSQQGATLDKLFRTTQETGIGLSDLSRLMVQFGSPLRQLGLDFDTSAAMFARFEKEGVNIQTLMPGLRMALKNFSMPTAALSDTLKKVGVDLKDGPSAALTELMGVIKDAPTDLKANALAFQVFGARAGPDMAAAVREGRFELDDLMKTIKSGDETIRGAGRRTMDFAEQWQMFKNNVLLVLEPIATRVFKGVGDAMKDVTDVMSDPKLTTGEKFTQLRDMALSALGDLADKVGEYAPKVAGALVQGFLDAPAWAQLATGGFLIKKLSGISAAGGIGSRIAAALSGKLGGGIAGKTVGALATPGFSPARPMFVAVVNGGIPGVGGIGGGAAAGAGGIALGGIAATAAGLGAVALAMKGIDEAGWFDSGGAISHTPFGALLGIGGESPGEKFATQAAAIHNVGEAVADLRKNFAELGKDTEAAFDRATDAVRTAGDAGISVEDDVGHTVHSLKAHYGSLLNAAHEMSKGQRNAFIDFARAAHDAGDITDAQFHRMSQVMLFTDDLWTKHAKAIAAETGEDWRKVAKATEGMKTSVSQSYDGMVEITGQGLQLLTSNTSAALAALDVKTGPEWKLQHADTTGGGYGDQSLQTGGVIVPGHGSGDKVPAMLEPGEVVLNRKAVAAMGGAEMAHAINKAIPRFQKGGIAGIGPRPVLQGPSATLREGGQAALNRVYEAAKDYLDKHSPAPGMGGTKGPKGIGTYAGLPMANWVISALKFAASKGVSPQPTSGYRSHATNVAAGRLYPSEHEGTQYPHGAVDFGGYHDPVALVKKMAVVGATKNFKYPLLAPIGFVDDGHASGTGHRLGGIIQKLAAGGSVIGRALPANLQKYNRLYAQHMAPDYGGETMPPSAIAELFEFFGMPGVTFDQITHGESGRRPGARSTDKGWGLAMITEPFHDALVKPFGGYAQMLNPIKNAIVSSKVYKAGGLSPWHGTQYLTDTNAHWQGDFGELVRAGASGGGAGGGGNGPSKPGTRGGPRPDHWGRLGPWTGMGYQHLPTKLANALKSLRQRTGVLDEKIANQAILDAMSTSPMGSELSPEERAREIGLNRHLLDTLIARTKALGKGIAFAPGGPRAQRLRAELRELQGITGKGGRILDVKSTLDQLGASPGPTETDAMRADLLQQLLDESRATGAVMRAQMPIFANFARAPFGGTFHQGGTVPGPVGAPRTINALGGETVVPVGGDGITVQLIVEDGAVDERRIKVLAKDAFGEEIAVARAGGPTIGQKARIR